MLSKAIFLFFPIFDIFQELDFMLEVVRAHANLDGNAFLRADPSFQEFLQ